MTIQAKPQVSPRPSVVPEGLDLSQWIESRTARYETRKLDWNALKFQADYDPKYRRAQMRYVGTGATGVASDSNTVPAEHFTFSTMVLPAGCEGPLHLHDDVEEIFFILKGARVKLMFQAGDEYFEYALSERDLVSVPPGVYRGLVNEGQEEALMIVCLGTSVPETPTYPPDHPLASIKRTKA
jgi:quercetin dioxygenase-like cupin family protein